MIIATIWVTIWEVVLLIGFGSFAILVVAVVPLGAMDILKLFRRMEANSAQRKDESSS